MQVKLLTSRGGSGQDGTTWTQEAGQVVEVSEAEAQRLIESHQAEAVK